MTDWMRVAQALPLGKSTRVPHGCSTSGRTSMIVSHRDDGSRSAHCFRCGFSGFERGEKPSLSQVMALRQARREADRELRNGLRLPTPQDRDVAGWPTEAKAWLFRAGLATGDIQNLGAFWHEPSGRVFIPVYNVEGELVYYQGRAIGDQQAKYINPKVDRTGLVADYHGVNSCGTNIVLTEDILSAYRVAKAAPEVRAWALMGTTMDDAILARLVRIEATVVVVWLDPDHDKPKPYGQIAAAEISRRLSLFGVANRRVVSRADPKLLSDAEIREQLDEDS